MCRFSFGFFLKVGVYILLKVNNAKIKDCYCLSKKDKYN